LLKEVYKDNEEQNKPNQEVSPSARTAALSVSFFSAATPPTTANYGGVEPGAHNSPEKQ